jgi:hypothetical protein
MFNRVGRNLRRLLSWFGLREEQGSRKDLMRIIRKGPAMRVIFFYPGEEGTYVDHAEVTLYENGIVHIASNQEETTTHLQNCEILWRFETDSDERVSKVRLLKPKTETRSPVEEPTHKSEAKFDGKQGKGNPSKNPELVE